MTVTTGGFQVRGKRRPRGLTARTCRDPLRNRALSARIAARSVRSDRVVNWECRELSEGTSQTVWRDRQLNLQEAQPRDAGFVETPVSCRGLDSPTLMKGSIVFR